MSLQLFVIKNIGPFFLVSKKIFCPHHTNASERAARVAVCQWETGHGRGSQ